MESTIQLVTLKPGDWIIWRGEQIQAGSIVLVRAGLIARVLALYPSPEFQEMAKELTGEIQNEGAIVEFENEFRFVLRAGMPFEKVQVQ